MRSVRNEAAPLASVSIDSAEDLLGHVLAGPAELRGHAADGIIVRDDRLVLEASVPRSRFSMT